MVIVDFWRNQNNQKGLTPANGISPNFISLQKVLSDSNNFLYLVAFQMPDWAAPLAGAASGETLRGALGAQIPPLMKRMRTSLHPLVCIGKDYLFYYGTAFPAETPVMANYMPRPRWLPDLTISLPGEAYARALRKTASLISAIC